MKDKPIKKPETDCFAYHYDKDTKKSSCHALRELVCTYKEKCSFYKHRADVDFRAIERSVKNYNGVHKNEEVNENED